MFSWRKAIYPFVTSWKLSSYCSHLNFYLIVPTIIKKGVCLFVIRSYNLLPYPHIKISCMRNPGDQFIHTGLTMFIQLNSNRFRMGRRIRAINLLVSVLTCAVPFCKILWQHGCAIKRHSKFFHMCIKLADNTFGWRIESDHFGEQNCTSYDIVFLQEHC